jgi:hypothetical protein
VVSTISAMLRGDGGGGKVVTSIGVVALGASLRRPVSPCHTLSGRDPDGGRPDTELKAATAADTAGGVCQTVRRLRHGVRVVYVGLKAAGRICKERQPTSEPTAADRCCDASGKPRCPRRCDGLYPGRPRSLHVGHCLRSPRCVVFRYRVGSRCIRGEQRRNWGLTTGRPPNDRGGYVLA